jgi:hypothetical protein
MVVGRFETVTLRLPALRGSVAGGSLIAEASCLGSWESGSPRNRVRDAEHPTRERVCSHKSLISAVQLISSELHETDQSPSG